METAPAPDPGVDLTAPGTERFGSWIGVGPLLEQVWATAPFLRDRPVPEAPGLEWWRILRTARERLPAEAPASNDNYDAYFALCCAAHHGTVGTYTPTDVDAKIRGHLWRDCPVDHLPQRWATVESWCGWDERLVSVRGEPCGELGLLSGHDGERFGVIAGALGAAVQGRCTPVADAARARIAAELAREGAALQQAMDATRRGNHEPAALLRLAWIITHNIGDLNQGINYWPESSSALDADRAAFGQLAQGNGARAGGIFLAAKRLYHLVEAEGHRNYPLREARALRPHPELLLPLGPCLETWGRRVAEHPGLGRDGRDQVVHALLEGCRRVPGQIGYYRALHGMQDVLGGSLERTVQDLPTAHRRIWAEPATQRNLAVKEAAFRASLGKKVLALLADPAALLAPE